MKNLLLIALGIIPIISGAQKKDSVAVEKIPWDGIDQTWQNGNDRRDSSVFNNMKFFTPSILMDIAYTHSFNNPNDNTVVGSTALARDIGSPIVELTVRADNPAQNFYARTGFQPLPQCLTFVLAGPALAALADQDSETLALAG